MLWCKWSNSEIPTCASGRFPLRLTGRVRVTSSIRSRNKVLKARSVQLTPGEPRTRGKLVWRLPWLSGRLVFGVGLLVAMTAAPLFSRQSATPQNLPSSAIPDVKCVIGLENIKPGAMGTLASFPNGLEFTTGKKKDGITTSSIQDVFTGRESRQDVSGMGGTLVEAAIPYGGGRFVSLFSHKVDVLAVEYMDSNGGFHGAIFVLPAGKATAFKNQLVAQGAKVSTHAEAPEPNEKKP
jgi:hypothetical protein